MKKSRHLNECWDLYFFDYISANMSSNKDTIAFAKRYPNTKELTVTKSFICPVEFGLNIFDKSTACKELKIKSVEAKVNKSFAI